jgi:hypothetical protein
MNQYSVTQFLIAVLILLSKFSNSQPPNTFSYQSILRDNQGVLLINNPVIFNVSILQGSENGIEVYSEVHNVVSNANALVSFEVGNGLLISGDMNVIDWSQGNIFIRVEVDYNSDNSTDLDYTTKMNSVPYAMFAKSAGQLSGSNFKSMRYPIGTEGDVLLFQGSYIVPEGKLLFVTWHNSSNLLYANGIVYDHSSGGGGAVFKSGQNLQIDGALTGILVNDNLEFEFVNHIGAYTVPQGSKLVLLSSGLIPEGNSYRILGYPITSGESSGSCIVLPGGASLNLFDAANSNIGITGYLIPN